MNRNVTIAIAALVVAAAAALFWYTQQDTPAPAPVAEADGDAPAADVSGVQEMVLGDANAPVTIVEYASYTCPHCATFHQGVFKDIKANYIDTGKVRFIFREVYFDRYGLWASMVARCAGADRYFGVADLLFENQSKWGRVDDPALAAEELRKVGRLAGVDDDKLMACLQDAKKAEKLVAWYQANAAADGINSTPSFIINGESHGNMSFSDMSAIIDAAIDG